MKFLIVIDMQNDFIDGSLGTPEAVKLVPKVVEKINHFEGDIIATRDTHYDDYLSTLEGQKLPVKHCLAGTDGWQIRKEIQEAIDRQPGHHYTVDKLTFGSTKLPSFLLNDAAKADNLESIELCGLCTDICVVSNALLLRAWFPNARIIVNSSLTEGVTPASKEAALKTMQMCQIDIED